MVSLLLGAVLVSGLFPEGAEAAGLMNKRLQPPSSYLGPAGNGPIFVGGFIQSGGAFAHEDAFLGYGASIQCRPGAAADFFPFLYRWNCGAVLQIEDQSFGKGMGLLSVDGIVRYYVEDMRDPQAQGSPYVGLGLGATRVDPPDDLNISSKKYWSILAEAGREWVLEERCLIWVRGQYRYYRWSGLDYRNWTFQVGVGIPWPF